MRQQTSVPIFKSGQTLLGVAFFMLLLILALPVYAAVTDESVDMGALSYNSIVNDVMKNRCPFSDYQSYVAYYNSCSSQNSCLPATEWFKSDTGFIPVEGIIVSGSTGNRFYPRTCNPTGSQNNSANIPTVPMVAGASTEVPEIQAVTGANDISFSIIAAAVASVFALIIFYFVLINQDWFTRLRLTAYSRYARFTKR